MTQYDSTVSTNNTYLPLCEIGTVYRHEMDPLDDRRNWYVIKEEKNKEMIAFVRAMMEKEKIDVIVCYHSGRTLTKESLKFLSSLSVPVIK